MPDPKSHEKRITELRCGIARMKDYLQLRLDMEDWHGVMDAAADIRELQAKLQLLMHIAED